MPPNLRRRLAATAGQSMPEVAALAADALTVGYRCARVVEVLPLGRSRVLDHARFRVASQPRAGGIAIGQPVPVTGKPSTWMRRTVHISGQIEPFFGTLDENVRLLEDALRVRTHLHDTRLTIEGEQDGVDQAVKIVEEYNHLTRHGRKLSSSEVKSLINVATEEPHESPRGMFEHARTRAFGKKTVTPKNASQRRYMEEIEKHDMMFAVGPGGTGKTYIAVAMAVSALLTKQVNRIILARPAVEAGERLGFLPGTLQEKVDPYMRPLYDALYDMLEPDKLDRFLEKGIIEVAPLAFMRGRTLNDSFVILDEAQNTTSEQMKMFLTRLGFNSKAVITGDITQIDLPAGKKSGLIEALEVCGKIDGIGVAQFNEKDVVRHNLVQQIIRAYEEYDGSQPQRTGNLANGKLEARAAESEKGQTKEILRANDSH
jgi:phosphate starvation-inducible protein PhoH and related proteins